MRARDLEVLIENEKLLARLRYMLQPEQGAEVALARHARRIDGETVCEVA